MYDACLYLDIIHPLGFISYRLRFECLEAFLANFFAPAHLPAFAVQ